MRKKKYQKTKSRWLWAGGIFLSLALIAVVNLSKPSRPSANAPDLAGNLPDTDSAFNVGTLIGQPAPAFTLLDANGQPYKFLADDGRKYVFVFNMGFI